MGNEQRVYAMALMKWGIHAQKEKFLEELAELNSAYWDFHKDPDNEEKEEHFIRELVDAHLMINQMAKYYDLRFFQEYKEKKLMELEKRLLEDPHSEWMAGLVGYEETKPPLENRTFHIDKSSGATGVKPPEWENRPSMAIIVEEEEKKKRSLPPAKYMGKQFIDWCGVCGTNFDDGEHKLVIRNKLKTGVCKKCVL